MFEAGKTYKTRDGREARVYAIDGWGKYPIHGAMHGGCGWEAETWDKNGLWAYGSIPSRNDLIPEPIVRYVNIYPDKFVARAHPHATREKADKSAGLGRVACVRVEYHEGQFDE